jgi:hypothetical protein
VCIMNNTNKHQQGQWQEQQYASETPR